MRRDHGRYSHKIARPVKYLSRTLLICDFTNGLQLLADDAVQKAATPPYHCTLVGGPRSKWSLGALLGDSGDRDVASVSVYIYIYIHMIYIYIYISNVKVSDTFETIAKMQL